MARVDRIGNASRIISKSQTFVIVCLEMSGICRNKKKSYTRCIKLNELNLKDTSITCDTITIIIQHLKNSIVKLDLSANNIEMEKILQLEVR